MHNGLEAYEDEGTKDLPHRVYQVRVITVLDPQVFWLELVRKSSLDPYKDVYPLRKPAIFQAGLLNIFPTEYDTVEPFFHFQWNASRTWMPVAITTLQKLLEQADIVYFQLKEKLSEEFSLIENIQCFLGQLYVSKKGVLENVSKILTKRCIAYKCSSRTKRYTDSNTMFLQRSQLEIDKARTAVLTYQTEIRQKEEEARKKAEEAIQKEVDTVRSEVNQIKKSLPSYLKQQLQEKGRYSQPEISKALLDMDRVLEECIRDVASERFGESYRAQTGRAKSLQEAGQQSKLEAYKNSIQQRDIQIKTDDCTGNLKTIVLPGKKKDVPEPAIAVSYLPAGLSLNNSNFKQQPRTITLATVEAPTNPPSHHQAVDLPVKETVDLPVKETVETIVETESVRAFTIESKWADSCDSEVCIETFSPALKDKDDNDDDGLDFKLIPKNAKIADSNDNSQSKMAVIIAKFKQSQLESSQIVCREHDTKKSDFETKELHLNAKDKVQCEYYPVGLANNKENGNGNSICSESHSSSGNLVSNSDGTQNRNIPKYRKVCKKKMKPPGDEEKPHERDITLSSGHDDYKKYERRMKRWNKVIPFKPEESIVDPMKGLQEFMNTTEYCLIDGSVPSQNILHTESGKIINASSSKDCEGTSSSNILTLNDNLKDQNLRREVRSHLKKSDELYVDNFFKSFKKIKIEPSSPKCIVTCEDLEKSFDSDRTSIIDSSMDTSKDLPTYSSHSMPVDVIHGQEQKTPVKPQLSFDLMKKFIQLHKSKTLEVSNDALGDAGLVNCFESVGSPNINESVKSTNINESERGIEPSIANLEVVQSRLDTRESKSYNIILQVLKRKKERLAALSTGKIDNENVEDSVSKDSVACKNVVKETKQVEKFEECLQENSSIVVFDDVDVCVRHLNDLSSKQVNVITDDKKLNTIDSEQLSVDENLGFMNMDVSELEKKAMIVQSNSNIANDEDESEIKTDESICGSEPRLQLSDEDPELVEDSDSPSSSNSQDCSASSFSSSSAWLSKGPGMLAGKDVSVKSSSFLSDKSYYSSPTAEVNMRVRARRSKVLKEYDSNRSCREAITEEDSVSRDALSDLRSVQACNRVPFDNSVGLDFQEAPIQYDYVHFSNEYDDDFPQLESGLIESILNPKVIIHSQSGNICSPWRELSSTMFSKAILTNLEKMDVKVPRKIQSTVWPTVSRGGSTFVVGPAGSGKGLSILAPVISQLSRMILNTISVSNGPVVLILCPNGKTAHNVHRICTSLLNGCTTSQGNAFNLLRIDDCDNSQNLWSFFEPCEILISTPRCLSAYMKYQVNILNFERTQYLIMEDLDTLDERFSEETTSIIDYVKNVANERSCTDLKMYATSKVWCDILKRIAKDSYDPTLVISALQECVFYSEMELQIRFTLSESKINRLREILLESGAALKRSVIVCESDAEILDVVDALKSDNYMVLKADTTMSLDVLNEVRLSWRNCKMIGNLILVCCDDNLHFLDIVNANWLIHFSLPKTFTKFNLRFSTMANNYPNLYTEDSQKTQKLKVDIFVDEMNSLQLPKIVNFVKRCNVEVPANINKLLQDITNLKDLNKSDSFVPLCDKLMGFGDCPNKSNCIQRHSIVEGRDKPADWIPRIGIVKCKVMLVHHSGLFSARLLEHTDLNGTINTMQQKNLRIAMEMGAYFSSEPNRRCHRFAKLGDVCAVKIDRSYERCQVIRIIPSHSKKHGSAVLLNLLDEESYVWKNAYDLFFLPEHLKEMKSTVVRVRIAGLKPAADKEYWSTTSIQKLRSKLNDNVFLKGRIVLGIGNTLWLENVQICKRLESLRLDAVKCNLKQYLLSEFAVENPSQLANLYRLCDAFNFELPLYSPSPKPAAYKQNLPEIQWAHMNEDDYTDVYFSSGLSPDCFFVRIASHQKILDHLQDDIQTYVEDLKSKLVDLPAVCEDMVDGGFYCLARYEDGRYYRARLEAIIDESNAPLSNLTSSIDVKLTYKCFFVDHGDWKIVTLDEMFPINAKFVLRMPFQAIECSLSGLKPLDDQSWTDKEIDFLYDLSFVNDTVDLKLLSAKYYAKNSPKVTTGNKYRILLADKESGETFADSFISNSMGTPIENELIVMNQDRENLKKYLSLPEEVEPDDDEEDTPVVEPIPDFILQQALTPYMNPDHSNPIDNADMLSDWNSMFTEFDDADNDWDCTFEANDFEQFKRCHNLPQMAKLREICEQPENVERKESSIGDDSFVMVQNTEKSSIVSDRIDSKLGEVLTKPGHMTPQILWYQNEKCITVKILLPDVNIYKCKIKVKSLYFETYTNDNIYKVDLELYGGIVPEKCSHVSKGSYVFIRLCKMTCIEWIFLTVNKEKRIVYDHDFVYIDEDDSDIEEEQKRLKEGIKARAGELIYEDGDDRDGDINDDISNDLPFIDTDTINRDLLRELQIEESDDDLID